MLKLVKEFRQFAVKGNMIDIAVGVIIGAAFNDVVDVLVKKIFLPPLSLLTDGLSWENKEIILREASEGVEKVAIGYGAFFEVAFDFLIIGFTVFLVVRFMNIIREKADDPKDTSIKTPKDIELLTETVELLKEQNKLLTKNHE